MCMIIFQYYHTHRISTEKDKIKFYLKVHLIDQIIVSSSRLAVRLGKGDILIRQIIRQCFDDSIKNIYAESSDYCGVRTRISYDVQLSTSFLLWESPIPWEQQLCPLGKLQLKYRTQNSNSYHY